MSYFTDDDEHFIIAALRHAAAGYMEDCQRIRVGDLDLGLPTAARFRLSDQFAAQAKRANDLADRIETDGLKK